MRKVIILLGFIFLLAGCGNETEESAKQEIERFIEPYNETIKNYTDISLKKINIEDIDIDPEGKNKLISDNGITFIIDLAEGELFRRVLLIEDGLESVYTAIPVLDTLGINADEFINKYTDVQINQEELDYWDGDYNITLQPKENKIRVVLLDKNP